MKVKNINQYVNIMGDLLYIFFVMTIPTAANRNFGGMFVRLSNPVSHNHRTAEAVDLCHCRIDSIVLIFVIAHFNSCLFYY